MSHNMDFFSEDDNILHDFLPFIRVFKDGCVERYIMQEKVPAGLDPSTGAQSKDVVISEEPKVSARIFIPKIDPKKPKRFPLVIHFHGGAFCTGSAFDPITKYSLTGFAAFANVVVISIDFRLAPEHLLPAAYDDCWAGVQYVAAHAKGNGPEQWLNEYADFDRVYFGGESSGANLAHDVGLRASVSPFDGVKLVGLLLIHPYFARREPDKIIKYLYPTSSGSNNDPRLNPGVDPRLRKLAFEKVLVCVAEKDMLRGRGVAYYMSLLKSSWGGIAEFVETEEEGHCFHLFDQTTPRAVEFLYKLATFVSDDLVKEGLP